MTELLKGVSPSELTTSTGSIPRAEVAAVSLLREERLWDGTLVGTAIGASTMLIANAALDGSDDSAAGAAVLGVLGGASLGALFDAGIARPDKPVFLDLPSPAEVSPSSLDASGCRR